MYLRDLKCTVSDLKVNGEADEAGRDCDGVRIEYIKGEGVNVMSDVVLEAREKLRRDVDRMYSKYYNLVETLKENVMEFGRVLTGRGIKDGEILDGLNILYNYSKDKKYERAEDTYQCCAALHRWTKYLACDDKYKKTVASKDDRFKRIYLNNYNFRRKWVAFLRGVVDYVELMYEDKGERKTYTIQAEIEKMTLYSRAWWTGFYWPTVQGHIETAEAKLAQEPDPAWYERLVPWDTHRGVLLEDGDGRRRDVGELLAELQKLG